VSNQKVDYADANDQHHLRFNDVYKLIRAKKFDEAMHVLVDKNMKIRKEFSEFPNHVWYCVGDIYFKMEQFSESIKFFVRAIREIPDDLQAWFALGNAYSGYNKHHEAANCFFVVLTIDPKYKDALYNYANAFMDMGEYERALHQLKNIRDKDDKVLANIDICKLKL
jgi:tetratricopeptide (TPR) repeat protein